MVLEECNSLIVLPQDENIQHIYASPFLRTVQTAHQVADVLSVPVRIEYGLSEGLLASELLTAASCLQILYSSLRQSLRMNYLRAKEYI